MDKLTIHHVLTELERLYPDARPALHFDNAYQLLVAVILSAQCTDVKVNMVTPALFSAYPTPADLAKAEQSDVEEIIHSCGLYRNKAKNLIAMANVLVNDYNGKVPEEHELLESLPGVGRKTANVVRACAFGQDAIAVDTHVFRVTNRLGLANADNVLDTEYQLMENIPKELWSKAHHWLIFHGRQVCHSRKPDCAACTLSAYCAYVSENLSKQISPDA